MQQTSLKKIDASNFEKVEAVGPYINFFLDKSKISADVLGQVIAQGSHYADKTSVTDVTSPLICLVLTSLNLSLSVTCVQQLSLDALANIVAKQGYKPVRINHLGDWGKQFGMLIVAYKKWGSEEAVKANPINELLQLYVRINAEAEEDPSIDEEAREWFRKLEAGDEEATALWQWFRDESLVEFNRLYDELGVSFDSYNGEAFYNDKMDEVVDILTEKGLLQESQGAQVVNLEKYGIEHPASSKIKMVRHSTSHVTWLLPSTVNVLTTLPKPSMWLVMNNLLTSNS